MLGAIPEAAEPFPLVLEDTLAREAMGAHDSIEAGFGGDRLPPSIVQFHCSLADLSDEVTMEADLSDPIAMGDAGVLQRPVTTIGDRLVHEAFDLTHEAVSFELMSL
jgi:hypothetical protein